MAVMRVIANTGRCLVMDSSLELYTGCLYTHNVPGLVEVAVAANDLNCQIIQEAAPYYIPTGKFLYK